MKTDEIVQSYFDTHRESILRDWFELLRFPTIGTDPARMGDCARCAAWLKRWVKTLGFEAEVCLTRGQPVLLAERLGAPHAPAVLFYGHYDVQPADPLEQWTSPPFDPHLHDGRVHGRGAQDNKGQFFAFLHGLAALIEAGVPLPTLRLVIEGEEESGSAGLMSSLQGWRRRLDANVLLVCDTFMHASGRPAITAGLRGIASATVRVVGPRRDLHSGSHGGLAPNPALGLARMLATLHHPDGAIAVDGLLDGILAPTQQELELAAGTPFDDAAYEREAGVPPTGGEQALPPPIRLGFRPTIEVNGLHAGYGGQGTKTIIPASAMAKLSLRLCPRQDPAQCLKAVIEHLAARVPAGLRFEVSEERPGDNGLRLPIQSPLVRLATDVLKQLDSRGPVFVWDGASIPVVSSLARASGAAPLLVGFGREDDCIHAPNESFSLEQFSLAMRYGGLILSALAE